MTFAAVGGLIQATASTFSLTPGGVGDLILVEVQNQTNSTVFATALSSSNVTWVQMGTTVTGVTFSGTAVLFAGTVTSASLATVTVTWSGTAPAGIGIDGQEFSSTVGSWALDVQGKIDSAGTNTFASLTPAAAGELYFGYGFDIAGAVAGTTTGYTFDVDAAGNGMCYNPACTSAAQAPVWGDSSMAFGKMVLVKETAAAAPAGPRPRPLLRGRAAAVKGRLASIQIKPPTTGGPAAPFHPPHGLLHGAAAAVRGHLVALRGRAGQPSGFRPPGSAGRGRAAARPGKLAAVAAPPPVLHPVVVSVFKAPGFPLRGRAAARPGKLAAVAAPPPVLHPAVVSTFKAPGFPLRGPAAARKGTLAGAAAPPPVIHPAVPAPFFPPRTLLRGPVPVRSRTPLTGGAAPPPPGPPPQTPHWQGSTHQVAATAAGNLIQGANHTGRGGPGDLKGDYERSGD